MSESELSPAVPPVPSIPPPAELPQFFAQQKSSTKPFKPPVPPQLHPIIPPLQTSGHVPSTTNTEPSISVEPTPPMIPTPPTRNVNSDPPPVPPPIPPLPPASIAPPLPSSSSMSHPLPVPPVSPPVVDPSPLDYLSRSHPAQARIPTPPVVSTVSESDKKEPSMNESAKMEMSNSNPQPIVLGMAENDTGSTDNEGEHRGVLGWFQQTVKQSEFLSKMASKAKSGMDTVLTTLDPGMKDFLEDVDTLDVVVDCDNDRVMEAIIEGFHRIFSAVTYRRVPEKMDPTSNIQIIGHAQAWTKAEERLTAVISSGSVELGTAALVIQPFLYQFNGTWFDSALVLMQFKLREAAKFAVYIQSVEVDKEVIETLQASNFSKTVGYAHAQLYGGDPDDWQRSVLSYSSSEFYRLAAIGIASQLKSALPKLQAQ